MDVVLAVVVVAVALLAAVGLARRLIRRSPPLPSPPWETGEPAGTRVVLDLRPEDPDHPAVQRLVDDAARRCLDADPQLDHVRVTDREGRELAVVHRPDPLPGIALPDDLHEPRTVRSRTPSPVERRDHPHPPPPASTDTTGSPDGDFADRFDLDERVRAQLRDPDDPVDLLRALLRVAGRRPEVRGDLLVVDDVALAVVGTRGRAVDDALARAFLRIQQARVPRGVILHLAWIDPAALHRREMAAPNVRHVGVEAVQRMADALRAGADPLDFVLGPAVLP